MLNKGVKAMNHPEHQYLNTLLEIIENGERVSNRTGVDTLRLLGVTHRYNFEDGFPLLTTKKVWFKGVVHELLWFLSGSTNIKYLVDNGVNIWNDDAYRHYLKNPPHPSGEPFTKHEFVAYMRAGTALPGEKPKPLPGMGEIGKVYGAQWRKWKTGTYAQGDVEFKKVFPNGVSFQIDQIANLVENLKNNPSSRRHILSAWNVADIDQCALPPCHYAALFSVSGNKLHCAFNMRSVDVPLGLPFNIASYALLTHLIAHVTGYEAGSVTWWGWDVHVYENQIDGVKEQLKREPHPFPKLWLNPDVKNIDDFTYDDIKIVDYKCHSVIKMPLST